MSEPYIGEIRILPYNYAPRDWVRCDGQLLPIAQFTTLYAIIGNTYGGDGRTTMGVPNLTNRAPMHFGNSTGPGLSNHLLGERGGTDQVTLTEGQIPAHTHSFEVESEPGDLVSPEGAIMGQLSYKRGNRTTTGSAFASQVSSRAELNTTSLQNEGNSNAHGNMQPFLSINFCMCVDGVWPPRS